MKPLYHTTKKGNLKSILKNGLRPSQLGIVYLSEKPDTWWNGDDYVKLEVNIDNLPCRLSTFGKSDLDEILCWGEIEPNRIKVLNQSRE